MLRNLSRYSIFLSKYSRLTPFVRYSREQSSKFASSWIANPFVVKAEEEQTQEKKLNFVSGKPVHLYQAQVDFRRL
jgi:hypothetical protein